MTQKIRWPMVIYFDASVLCKLPHDLSNPDLVQLQNFAKESNIGLFVPEVAVKEWVFHHQKIVRKQYASIESASRTVGKYLQRQPMTFESITTEDLLAAVEGIQLSYLVAAGITLLLTPQIELKRLIEMAVHNEKPFKEEDKGFRDSLIVFTIAEHAKKFAGHYILVASADPIFQTPEVMNHWRQVGVEPLVAETLSDAVVIVDNLVDEAVKTYIDQEATRILEFLRSQQDAVFQYVQKNAEVSESFVRGGVFGKQDFYGTLERVRQTRLLEITRASKGRVTRGWKTEQGRVPITFDIKAALDITVNTFSLLALFGRKFTLEEPVDLREPQPLQRIQEDITVERTITVEATASEDKDGKFSDLRIEKILAY